MGVALIVGEIGLLESVAGGVMIMSMLLVMLLMFFWLVRRAPTEPIVLRCDGETPTLARPVMRLGEQTPLVGMLRPGSYTC